MTGFRLTARALLLAALLFGGGSAWGQTQPHLPRGTNLLANPNFTGITGWSLRGTGGVDTPSRTADGSGSLRIDGANETDSTQLVSTAVPARPNTLYTLGAYLRTVDFPNHAAMWCGFHDASGRWTHSSASSRQSMTGASRWEEVAILCRTGPNDAFVSAQFIREGTPQPSSPLWVDEVYLGEGLGFGQPPAPKQAFDGTATRVDALGNFDVWDGAAWRPFVPFCICTDGDRADWTVYSRGGFNCNTWAWVDSTAAIKKAQGAGMMSGIELGGFINGSGRYYQQYTRLGDWIRSIHGEGLTGSVLMYYFDNELVWAPGYLETGAVERQAMQTIDQTERALNGGRRLWPRYVLNINEGIHRELEPDVDLVGDYVSGSSGGGAADGTGFGLMVLDNIEGQRRPKFAQINHPQTAASMRRTLYTMLIAGAKGFSYWRDYAPGKPGGTYNLVPIETTDWYAELPQMRAEIEQALPVLREPHWTSWRVGADAPAVKLGTREHAGEGYVLLVNDGTAGSSATFTLAGLPYEAASVADYFTGARVASVQGGAFTATLPATTALWRLVPAAGPDAGIPLDAGAGPDAGAVASVDAAAEDSGAAVGRDAGAPDAAPPLDAALPLNADAGLGAADSGEPGALDAAGGCGCSSAGGGTTATLLALATWVAGRAAARRRA